ncbi:MAG: LysR family transcriptional regulator [Rhizobiaceae bacterium]|nr:LysR family transcriptional regulator [Rhizobiaceae bacterium]
MDWRAIKFDWNRARAFLVTAEEGSLSAAARALGMTQPTLGRQVDALEHELGVLLFDRAGRSLVLTPAGLDLLDHVRAMGEAAGRVSLAASGKAQSIEGSIVVTASEIYSAYLLPPVVARLRREHPGITVEVVASNATIDLKRREADIAVRSFRPTEPDLVARKIGDDRRAARRRPCLAGIGDPNEPVNLSRAAFIGFDTSDVMLRDGLNRMELSLTRSFPRADRQPSCIGSSARPAPASPSCPRAVGDAEPSVRRVLPDFQPMEFDRLTAHREGAHQPPGAAGVRTSRQGTRRVVRKGG